MPIDNYGNDLSEVEIFDIVVSVLQNCHDKIKKEMEDTDIEHVEINGVNYHYRDTVRAIKRTRRFIDEMFGLINEWVVPDDWYK